MMSSFNTGGLEPENAFAAPHDATRYRPPTRGLLTRPDPCLRTTRASTSSTVLPGRCCRRTMVSSYRCPLYLGCPAWHENTLACFAGIPRDLHVHLGHQRTVASNIREGPAPAPLLKPPSTLRCSEDPGGAGGPPPRVPRRTPHRFARRSTTIYCGPPHGARYMARLLSRWRARRSRWLDRRPSQQSNFHAYWRKYFASVFPPSNRTMRPAKKKTKSSRHDVIAESANVDAGKYGPIP